MTSSEPERSRRRPDDQKAWASGTRLIWYGFLAALVASMTSCGACLTGNPGAGAILSLAILIATGVILAGFVRAWSAAGDDATPPERRMGDELRILMPRFLSRWFGESTRGSGRRDRP